MTPVIYADILFLFNFLINSVVLAITSRFLKTETGALKIAVGAGFGGIYAVLMFFPSLEILYTVFFKGIILFGISYVVFGGQGFWGIIKNFSVFLLVNLTLGGGLLALIFLTDFGTTIGSIVSGGGIYMNISPVILVLGIAGTYIFLGIYQRMSKRALFEKSLIKRIKIEHKNKAAEIDVFIDTGCRLLDPINDSPAIIAEYDKLKLILSDEEREIITERKSVDEAYGAGMRVLPFSTICGDDAVFGIVAEHVCGEDFMKENVTVGLIFGRKLNGSYGGIINPELLLKNIKNAEGFTV